MQKLRARKAAFPKGEHGAPPQANVGKGGAGKVCLLEQNSLHAAFGKSGALRHAAGKAHIRQGAGAEMCPREAATLECTPVQRGANQRRARKITVVKQHVAKVRAAQIGPAQAHAFQRTAAPFAFGKRRAGRAAARESEGLYGRILHGAQALRLFKRKLCLQRAQHRAPGLCFHGLAPPFSGIWALCAPHGEKSRKSVFSSGWRAALCGFSARAGG